ncbi:DEAD/DEAH box helicase family protein [Patescibacteria group bacterium]|jgi:superfamily II DNA or RNA helicase|nr:DEAD/DEAH box helicase family protein [Patescibacteria group bacterium]
MIKPHKYQVPIIRDVVRALKRDGRTLMVMATGTGKTITSALVVQQLARKRGRMLFLCHNNDILRQAMDSYRAVFNGSHTMGMFTGEEKADPKVTEFLFASFQTMHGHRKLFEADSFDIVVVDESHHTQAETFRPTIEYFKPKYLLGMTATPDREDGLQIREQFGEPSVTLTLQEAVARKFLSDIDYKLMTVGTAARDAIRELKRRVLAGERITLRELNDEVFIHRLDEEIADEIMSYKAQGIVFCTSIEQAEGMVKRLKKARPYHSKLDRSMLAANLDGFRRGRIKYLLVKDMFNEGIDVPDTELIVFLRSTESMTVYLQQLGRGLRKTATKSHVTVLDFVGNCDRVKIATSFVEEVQKLEREYGDDRIRSTINASSIIFSLDEESRDLQDILRRLDVEFYPTMAEAMAAVRRLRIKSRAEYVRRYREDQRLHSAPNLLYASEWKSWAHFLRGEGPKNFYPTLALAAKAARKLGADSQKSYWAVYKEDPRLPMHPHIVYASEWKSWAHFLRGEGPKNFYPTLALAAKAARKLGADSQKSYMKVYKKDPRLPSNPQNFYSTEWKSWGDFLGLKAKNLYPSLAQTSKAARRLGYKTPAEYRQKRSEDPRLPSDPQKFYPSEWRGWGHMLRGETPKKS